VTKSAIPVAWGRILRGQKPLLSIEITKECPLRCPGCYAYEPEHLGDTPLRQLADYRGAQLVDGVLSLVRRYRPLHVSIIGGEPLVRYRELSDLLPKLERMGIEVQLVTSAVRPIPAEWASLRCLHLVVSVDGLAPEHDLRRAPATYSRILQNISGHQVIVHCTITRQQVLRTGYLAEFARFWSERPEARKIWFSLFTPQVGNDSAERLTNDDRARALAELANLAQRFRKVHLSQEVLDGYLRPPASPAECIFAQSTLCLSADLATRVTPCQFGGKPVCSECGCLASAGLTAIGRYKLAGIVPVADLFSISRRLGEWVGRFSATARPLPENRRNLAS
jgi:organic radical activating enzyme